jgi:protein TonB
VLPITLAVSIVFHAFLLLVSFTMPSAPAGRPTPQLDVVLVNSESSSKPTNADFLAQANLDGGGNTEADLQAKSNLPVLEDMRAADELQLSARQVRQLEEQAAQLLASINRKTATDSAPKPVKQSEHQETLEDPAIEQRKLEIARLEAAIAKEWQAYQKLPRRKFIGARAESAVYAEYVENWRQRIEAVGTENYPQEARRHRIFGSMMITVSIKADGSVEKVEIENSSGHRVLDQAAVRIIDLAGPFLPFPLAVRSEYDILSITRMWSFTRDDLGIAITQ